MFLGQFGEKFYRYGIQFLICKFMIDDLEKSNMDG